jgi:hypothetical protein
MQHSREKESLSSTKNSPPVGSGALDRLGIWEAGQVSLNASVGNHHSPTATLKVVFD